MRNRPLTKAHIQAGETGLAETSLTAMRPGALHNRDELFLVGNEGLTTPTAIDTVATQQTSLNIEKPKDNELRQSK